MGFNSSRSGKLCFGCVPMGHLSLQGMFLLQVSSLTRVRSQGKHCRCIGLALRQLYSTTQLTTYPLYSVGDCTAELFIIFFKYLRILIQYLSRFFVESNHCWNKQSKVIIRVQSLHGLLMQQIHHPLHWKWQHTYIGLSRFQVQGSQFIGSKYTFSSQEPSEREAANPMVPTLCSLQYLLITFLQGSKELLKRLVRFCSSLPLSTHIEQQRDQHDPFGLQNTSLHFLRFAGLKVQCESQERVEENVHEFYLYFGSKEDMLKSVIDSMNVIQKFSNLFSKQR